ncbi:putative transcription factor TFIIB, Cyclin-like superfamily [Arabidopsis thaliana]
MGEDGICLECKRPTETVVNYKNGDTICIECGHVIENNFIDELDGAPTNPNLKSGHLPTIIFKPNGRSSSLASKLRRTQNQMMENKQEEVVMKKAYAEIERMSEALGLTFGISYTACKILSKLDKKNLRGPKSLRGLCAASVSRACSQVNIPKTLKEITTVANVDMKEINKAVKLLEDSFGTV